MTSASRCLIFGALCTTLAWLCTEEFWVLAVAFWAGTTFGMLIMGAHILFNKDSDA